MSWINFSLSGVEHEKRFITSGSGELIIDRRKEMKRKKYLLDMLVCLTKELDVEAAC